MKKIPIKITKGIKFSIPRSKWICSWCEERIKIKEESLLFSGLDQDLNGNINPKMSGARIHLDCLGPMCKEIKDAVKNKNKYAILNNL